MNFRTRCELAVELIREQVRIVGGQHLAAIDGGLALTRIVRPLVSPEVPVKAGIAQVEGSNKRIILVTSSLKLTGSQVVKVFAARFRQEEGYGAWSRGLAGRWPRRPIERTSQAQRVMMSVLRLDQLRPESFGELNWWFRPAWNLKQEGSAERARCGARKLLDRRQTPLMG